METNTASHPAIHAHRSIVPDPNHELERAAELRKSHTSKQLMELLDECSVGSSDDDGIRRRLIWRALVRQMGHAVQIGCGILLRHPETFEIGDGVFIGDQACLQGRIEGSFVIGTRAWIGPQCYFDARAIEIGESVGVGPGVRILCSEHSGEPVDVPIIQTPLRVAKVTIGRGADIGMSACLLPGVTVGEGAIIGAGAVVTRDVPSFAVAAGVPARVLRYRIPKGGPTT